MIFSFTEMWLNLFLWSENLTRNVIWFIVAFLLHFCEHAITFTNEIDLCIRQQYISSYKKHDSPQTPVL